MRNRSPGSSLLDFNEFDFTLQDFDEFDITLQDFNEFDLTLHDFNEFDLTLHDFDEFDITLQDFNEFDLTFGDIEIDGAVWPCKTHSLEHISVQPAARRSKHIKFSRRHRLDGVRLQNPCSTEPGARETSVTLHQSRCQRLLGLKSVLDKRRLQRISRKCNELCPQ